MDLKFDEMVVDTSLAQEYIKENKVVSEWYEKYRNSTEDFKPFVFDGKLFIEESHHTEISFSPQDPIKFTRQKLALAARLKQNAALIAQLEYYIRNIPIEDTNTQLNLIIQYLNSCQLEEKKFFDSNPSIFCFSDEPLLKLQMLVKMKLNIEYSVRLYIKSKAVTIITHLFCTLFHEAGYEIELQFVDAIEFEKNEKGIKFINEEEIKGLDSGTVAIVSEEADIDSAVDRFLAISIQAPWRLRRILVQESVYQQFKDALSWKCNLKKQENKPLDFNVVCSETLSYNGKLFLIDPVNLPIDQNSVVIVEAYRTRKEMISLVQTDRARYLSLWANDVAEINEVTHSTKSPVVWVNNIADFRGPASVADAVFSFVLVSKIGTSTTDRVAKLCELLQSWQKLDYETRRGILCKVLDEYIELEPTNEQYIELRSAISTCTRNSFIDVGKDYVCVGIWEPVGLIHDSIEKAVPKDCLMSILNGNGFYLSTEFMATKSTKNFFNKISLFEEAGVPLINIPSSLFSYTKPLTDKIKVYTTMHQYARFVWTNTGTIFAN